MSRQPVWLFDLDNTPARRQPEDLSAHQSLHDRVPADESRAIARGCGRTRMHYWHRYGATLLGLVRHHGTNPGHFRARRIA